MKKMDDKKRRRAYLLLCDRLGSVLIAAALSGSLATALFGVLGISAGPIVPYIASLCGCILVALLSASPLCALATVVGLGSTCAILYRAEIRPWQAAWDLLRSLIGAESGEVLPLLAASSQTVAAVACAFLGALLFGLARMQGGVYPAVTLTLITYLAGWYLGAGVEPMPLVFSLLSLVALFARGHDMSVPWRRVLPTAVAVALLTVAILPPAGTTWAPLSNAAQKVRDLVEEYFRFNTPRTTYSVANDGWQQMGERLGGPVNPLRGDVLSVETDSPVLLRGSIKRGYTTYSWVDNGRNNRYLYLDPTKANLRAALFSADLSSAVSVQGAFSPSAVRVSFLREGTSTLFVPDVLENIEAPIEMAVYYNDTGEVFLTRDVAVGDAYSASGWSPVHGDALSDLLALASNRTDAWYDAIREEYTALPEGINSGVYELARRVVAGAQTPYEAATLLNEYLRSGEYAYSTDVDFPPYGVDFVSYFLLNSREGYCTYFASAMAVMARMVGLPSRYVEGYLAVPDESGVAVVTGEDAHAWAEIYFRGVGWVEFDPTPGGEQHGDGNGDTAGDQQPEPSPEPTREPDDGEGGPEDGLAQETPEPQEEYTEPTPPPLEGDATPPPEEGDTQDQPDDEGSSQNSEDRPPLSWIWKALLALLLLAALALAVRYRERATRPEAYAAVAKEPQERLMVWYRILLTILDLRGRGASAGETPAQMAARLEASGYGSESITKFLQVVTVCRYGAGEPNESAMALAAQACRDACRGMRRLERLRLLTRRMTKGFGDYKSIP